MLLCLVLILLFLAEKNGIITSEQLTFISIGLISFVVITRLLIENYGGGVHLGSISSYLRWPWYP